MKIIFKGITALFLLITANGYSQTTQKVLTTTYLTPASEDILNALTMLGAEIYSIDLPIKVKKEYNLSVYADEYAKDTLLKHQRIFYTSLAQGIKTDSSGKITFTIIKKNDDLFQLGFNVSGGDGTLMPFMKDVKYNFPHVVTRFQNQPLTLDKKIPLLLYGSGWLDPKLPKGTFRFCMERALNPDLSSNAFKMMPHHYLFSVEINEII